MTNSNFIFTFENIERQYKAAQDFGYTFLTCSDYYHLKDDLPEFVIVNRVDIDISVSNAGKLAQIFNNFGIKATFFLRLHAHEYNPFSFSNYRILKFIKESGHEIGYHSEIVDQAVIWNENPEVCLFRDLNILNNVLDISVKGVASHGGMTGLNNLDFWKTRAPSEFGLYYEAYDETSNFGLFNDCFYISDSENTRWKCYDKGVLRANDRRSFGDHLCDKHKLIYLLIHPEIYYHEHPYELNS
jgi:hypothetical protein